MQGSSKASHMTTIKTMGNNRMKSFTAKEFSRCPAKVYEAAREDGKAEVTHDRFGGCFHLYHVPSPEDIIEDGALIEISQQILRVVPYKKAPD